MASPFKELTVPQAVIGATDIAMRQHLPRDALAYSVTAPMFERFCALDERSCLHRPFWKGLWKIRKGWRRGVSRTPSCAA